MEGIVFSLNLEKICRACLIESDSMFSVHSALLEQNCENIPTIGEILTNISNINVEDEKLPSMICTKCINSAHNAYKFQQQCNKSQILLETYLQQIKNMEIKDKFETDNTLDLNEIAAIENTLEKECENVTDNGNLVSDGLIKEFIQDEYLPNDDLKDGEESEDCDDLKSCIPLGEDTVDQLIKDNFRVENLELISPKLNFCGLNLDEKHSKSIKNEKVSKEVPSMNYYKSFGEDGEEVYTCNVCVKPFKSPNSLRVHLKSHDEEKPYVCTQCKRGFKVYCALKHHIRSHSEEQPFECKECGKKYKHSGTLIAHMRIHTGSKPFLCTICGRGFRQAPDLTYHMRTHTKEKPYMCNVCGKTMSMQCHLVQHMRSHTGEKPFKCSECSKAFPSSTRLKRHAIVHTSLKPYKCTVCNKSFNRSNSLKVHSKTHSGVKAYTCSICNKSFTWNHSFKAHQLTHEKTDITKDDNNTNRTLSQINDNPLSSINENSALHTNESLLNRNDNSLVDFTAGSTYPNDNVPLNESFVIFTNSTEEVGNDAFQICTYAAGESDLLDTFTLYSSDTDQKITSGNS
ncbi:zinc finger protein ZFP2-like [Diabrotica virgifera virgifera]|uniref:Uncharacterized protein n=1 Tax=Diabrotica virgifera virgifera TaxID=50390 RepID=A0ABM5KI52_DIAVI|nr:zinc finger protein ZFP2-like [Diabrotica virgifera virgifera]